MPHFPIKDRILKALYKTLSDQNPISGEELAHKLNVTRSDINKHIKKLKTLGYGITARPHSGYLLTNLPSEITLKNLPIFLSKECPPIYIKHYTVTNSTQLVAKKFALSMRERYTSFPKGWYLFVSDRQTGGYGRMRREWCSPEGGLWFSLLIPHPNFLPTDAPSFSLAFSLAVRSAIEKTTLLKDRFFLKWPNDIVFYQRSPEKYKKVAGIILETSMEANDIEWLILGCGVNVNNKIPSEISKIATSLFSHTGVRISIPTLLKEIISETNRIYQIFCKEGFKGTLSNQYERFDILRGNEIEVFSQIGEVIRGKAECIDYDGCLIIHVRDNDKSDYSKKVYAGDVTVRKFQ